MTPEGLHKSYRIATQNQKCLPNGYIKSKNDSQMAPFLCSHLGAKREPNGSHF